MRPHPSSPRRWRVVALGVVGLVAGLGLAGCGDDAGDAGGFDTARAVVDEHVARSSAYDLAADCGLRHPDVIAEMAALDGRDADGYCKWATASLIADATDEQRARTESIYTDPMITEVSSSDDEATFTLEAADGSYHEDIAVERVDGRWYLRSAEGTDAEHDHAH